MSDQIEIRNHTDFLSINADAIAHGCNTQGVWGSGVAKLVRNNFPKAYEIYRDYCMKAKSSHILGTILPVVYTDYYGDSIVIYNLFTQEFYGRDPNVQYASLEACRSSFREMFSDANIRHLATISMPHLIGCGLGGLQVDDVMQELTQALEESEYEGHIIICKYP